MAALLEALPGLPLPVALQTRWPDDMDAPARQAARAAAYVHMTARGVLTRAPAGPDDVIDAMNPAVLDALLLPATADVGVLVRSWCRGTSFVGGYALRGDRGVGMVRRWDVEDVNGVVGRRTAARPGLELSAFAAASALTELLRTVPPVEGHPGEPSGLGIDLRALDSAALVAALRAGRNDVAGTLCERAGLVTVPPVLQDLAERWEGAFEVTLRRRDGALPPVSGTWWLAGGRWLRALVTGAGEPGGASRDPGDLDGLLELRRTTRGAVEADLLAALVEQLSVERGEVDDRG